jgi:pimeloyl-ACP methyl ester carboxylesterase
LTVVGGERLVNRLCLRIALLALLCLTQSVGQAATSAPGRGCHLPGAEEGLRCLSLAVPLFHDQPQRGSLTLHVTVAPAYREQALADPLYVLAGGPGQAGSEVLAPILASLRRVRATRDIVIIDQRGTGRSGHLECASLEGLDQRDEAVVLDVLKTCVAGLKTPLAAYTTLASARDIDAVRRALAHGAINLFGASYGTRLAQAYARLYPKHTRTLVLDGVVAPDQVIPAGGRDGQSALDLLLQQCQADAHCQRAFPALRQEIAGLSGRLAKAPAKISMRHPRTAEPHVETLSRQDFINTLHRALYTPFDSRRLPYFVHSAWQGRWEPLVTYRNLARDQTSTSVSTLMHLAVICAEDAPRLDAAALAEDARDSFLGDGLLLMLDPACKVIKVPSAAQPAPTRIAAPVLMLSGALDPVTPPRRAEAAARHMAAAQHLVAREAGHNVSSLGCAGRLMRSFLDQPAHKLDGACLNEVRSSQFQLGNAGPHP